MSKKAVNDLDGTDNPQGERTTILVSISEKGGMGKTIVGLTAAEQLTAANRAFFLVDADVSTPNVGLTYTNLNGIDDR
jgi:Mrp family chromosome partitioning ATPase